MILDGKTQLISLVMISVMKVREKENILMTSAHGKRHTAWINFLVQCSVYFKSCKWRLLEVENQSISTAFTHVLAQYFPVYYP